MYIALTLSPSNKLSEKFLVCFNFQSASMLLKVCEDVWLSNSLDPNETPSYSASHPDPSCLHMAPGCDWWAKDYCKTMLKLSSVTRSYHSFAPRWQVAGVSCVCYWLEHNWTYFVTTEFLRGKVTVTLAWVCRMFILRCYLFSCFTCRMSEFELESILKHFK